MNKFGKNFTVGKILFWDVFITSFLIAVMAVVPSPYFLSLFSTSLIPYISFTVLFSLMVAVITTANISLSALFQKIVPISMMGRVGTVFRTGCMAMSPLGLLIFGVLFDNISSWSCFLIASLILLITILSFRKALFSFKDDDIVGIS